MKSIAYTLAMILAATPMAAQSWDNRAEDTGGLVYGSVSASETSLAFACNAPSPQNRPLHETDDHETNRSAPFAIFVEVSFRLIDNQGINDTLTEATLIVDGAGYRLPPVVWSDFFGTWQVELQMDDPMFDALREATDLVFDAGRGTAWQYPLDGLSRGIDAAMQPCVDAWAVAGNTIPVTLSRFWREGAEDALSPAQALAALASAGGNTPAPPSAPVSGQRPQTIEMAAAEGCSGGAVTIDPASVQTADLDGDGVDDYLLNHNGVRCDGRMSGYCGAANCSIDVFLSTQGYAHRPDFLGMGVGTAPLPDGRIGLQISGTYSMCGETGLCPGPLVWNGTEFDLYTPQSPAEGSPSGPKN